MLLIFKCKTESDPLVSGPGFVETSPANNISAAHIIAKEMLSFTSIPGLQHDDMKWQHLHAIVFNRFRIISRIFVDTTKVCTIGDNLPLKIPIAALHDIRSLPIRHVQHRS